MDKENTKRKHSDDGILRVTNMAESEQNCSCSGVKKRKNLELAYLFSTAMTSTVRVRGN